MEKVSIIINCLNGEEYLGQTLTCLKKQSFQDFEIIFWDNGSTDATEKIAKKFDKRLKYYRGEETIPLGAARNRAIEKTTGEYIAFIDCDDLWDYDKLEKQVNIMERFPDVGLVFSNYYDMIMPQKKLSIKENNFEEKIMSFSQYIDMFFFCTSSTMIRRKAIEKMEIYCNENYKYCQEAEFFLRIAYNWNTYYQGKPFVKRRVHSEMTTTKSQSHFSKEYAMMLECMRKMDRNFDNNYPKARRKLQFYSDYFEAKDILPKGENKRVRQLMKPYLLYDFRGICYYTASLFPRQMSKRLASMMRSNKA